MSDVNPNTDTSQPFAPGEVEKPPPVPMRPILRDLADKIKEETKMAVEKLKEHKEISQTDLAPLTNEYDTRYRRLALGESMRRRSQTPDTKEIESYYAVSLNTVHLRPNGKTSTTVLLVGGPGDGKTTTAIKYTTRAMRRKITGPSDVKLIVFIEGKDIQWERECRPFDLLFKDQFANIVTSAPASKPLEKWIAQNPSEVLVIIDGIDVAKTKSISPARITLDQRVHPIFIIINLLRCDIYRGMWVMCTTTPQWLWKLTYVIDDVVVVNILGFDERDVLDILVQLTGERQRVGLLLHCYPAIKDMCKTPAMLIHLAGQIKENETMTDIKILLDAIDFFDSHHAGNEEIVSKQMKFIMAVAHKAATTGTVDLEIQDSDKNTAYAMAHYISVTYHENAGRFVGKTIQNHHLRYKFISVAMRDILAAFHWLSMDNTRNYKNLQETLSSAVIPNYILLGVAIIADEEKWRVVTSISKTREDTLRHLQKILLKFLESKNKSTPISDVKDLRVLRQCGPLLARGVMTRVTAIKLNADCDASDVISVAQSIPSIVRAKVYGSMKIYSSSLALLEANVAMNISNLKIAGDMRDDAVRLSRLLATRSHSEDAGSMKVQIGSVELSDYNMKYDVASNFLEVDELKEDSISVINDLFHVGKGGAKIQVQRVNMDNSCRQSTRSFLEKIAKMPEEANNCELKVKVWNCPDDIHSPMEIKELMTHTQSIQVGILSYGDITVRPQALSGDYANNTPCLVTDEVLTVSSALVSLVKSGVWNEVRTREFNIFVEFKTAEDNQRYPFSLRVQRSFKRGREREAYDEIVPFMIRLGCEKLEFSDMMLTAQYIVEDGEKQVDKMKLSSLLCGSLTNQYPRVNSGKQYMDMFRSLFQVSDARLIEIGSITFQRNYSDHNQSAHEWNYKVLNLECEGFGFLNDLQSLLKTPPIKVDRCSLHLIDILSLQKLASNISQIGELDIDVGRFFEMADLHQLIRGINWSKLILHLYTLRIVVDRNQRGNITVPEITVDQFDGIYGSLLPLVANKSLFRVEKLILPRDQQKKYEELVEYFTNVCDNTKAVTLQLVELAVDGSFIDPMQICLDNESRFLIVSNIRSDDGTDIKFRHNENNTIQSVSINSLRLESLLDIDDRLNGPGAVRPNLVFCIQICYFARRGSLTMADHSERLINILVNSKTIWNISSLQLQAPFNVEVFKGYKPLLRSRQIREMVYQDEFEFRTGRCSGEHNGKFFGNIDRITVKGLKKFVDDLEGDCPEIIKVGQCEIAVNQDDIFRRLSGMTDNDMYQELMDVAMEAMRKKRQEQVDMLKIITQRYKDLQIETVTVTGTAEDIEALTTDVITGNEETNYLSQVRNVKLDTLALENHQLVAKVLNSGVGLEANCLLVNEPNKNREHWTTTMNMISNNNFKVLSIESKSNLDGVLQIIAEISQIADPKSILTEDANLKIENHPSDKTKLLVARKGSVRMESVRALSGSLRMKVTTEKNYKNELHDHIPSPRPGPPPPPRPPPPPLRGVEHNDTVDDEEYYPFYEYPTAGEFQPDNGDDSPEDLYEAVDEDSAIYSDLNCN